MCIHMKLCTQRPYTFRKILDEIQKQYLSHETPFIQLRKAMS